MSNTLLRELFRSLETSIHERLVVLEELIRNTEGPQTGSIEQSLQITRMDPALQERLGTMDTTLRELFTLQKSIGDALKESKRREEDMMKAFAKLQARVETLEARPVEADAEAEVADAEEHVIEDEEGELAEEEEEEGEGEGEGEDAEEEEGEDGGEEGGLEGEEFSYKGRTFFRSTDNKVYLPDEDGAVDPDTPYGLWVANPKLPEGGKISRFPN